MVRDKGTYALILVRKESQQLQIGKLGKFSFPPGYYIYTGSALGGLWQRIRRHRQPQKKPHWHIDYLLPYSQLVEIWYCLDPKKWECTWAQFLSQLPQAQVLVAGFGASDCSCSAHLFYFPRLPPYPTMEKRWQRAGIQVKRLLLENPLSISAE